MVVMEDEGNKVEIGLRNIINKLHDMKKKVALWRKSYMCREHFTFGYGHK